MSTTVRTLACFLLLLTAASAQEAITPEDAAPALGGYSPVSYFEHDKPQPGLPEFAVSHYGVVYYLTSAEQIDKFNNDPQSFVPLFPNHCPYNLALGRAVSIDPTNFRIVAGRLLLFHRSEEMDGLKEWGQHDEKDQERLLDRAKGNFARFRF